MNDLREAFEALSALADTAAGARDYSKKDCERVRTIKAALRANGGEAVPDNCREKLQAEGGVYPRSNCDACNKGIVKGCPRGFNYSFTHHPVPGNEAKARTLEDAAIKVVAEVVEIEVRLDDGQDIVEGTVLIEEHIAEWLHKEAARLRATDDKEKP